MHGVERSGGLPIGASPASSEADLWVALKRDGDASAREKLFALHLGFARQIANRRYVRRRTGEIEFGDLCQAAYAGLLEAIDQFDPGLNWAFRSYAYRRVVGSVLDSIAKTSEVQEQIRFRNRSRNERVRSLSVADASQLPAEEAMQALIDLAVGLAVGFMLEDTGQFVEEGAMDRRANAYHSVAWKDLVRSLLTAGTTLPEREQVVIRHHYVNGMTFEKIGAVLGVTKGRVFQIHAASLARLKQRLASAGEFRLEG